MTAISLPDLGRVARWVGRRLLRDGHADVRQDVEAEVGLAWAERAAAGDVLTITDALRAGIHYLRRLWGDRRYNGRRAYEHVPLESWDGWVPPPPEEWGLLGWRLARAWPTLTPTQQAGLWSVLDDGYGAPGEAAVLFGVHAPSIAEARRVALRRLDDPGAYSRRAYIPPEMQAAVGRERVARYRARKSACTRTSTPRGLEGK